MPRPATGLILALIAAAALAASALAAGAMHHAPKAGSYAGTTSEASGAVSFKVVPGGKRVTGFTTNDGYNGMCKFSGGAGGLGNFTVMLPSMKVTKTGAFTGTVKAKLGPFSGTFTVKGRFTSATTAHGSVTQVGSKCGSAASNPTTPDYLETFTASRA